MAPGRRRGAGQCRLPPHGGADHSDDDDVRLIGYCHKIIYETLDGTAGELAERGYG
jgi:hypothetical protein